MDPAFRTGNRGGTIRLGDAAEPKSRRGRAPRHAKYPNATAWGAEVHFFAIQRVVFNARASEKPAFPTHTEGSHRLGDSPQPKGRGRRTRFLPRRCRKTLPRMKYKGRVYTFILQNSSLPSFRLPASDLPTLCLPCLRGSFTPEQRSSSVVMKLADHSPSVLRRFGEAEQIEVGVVDRAFVGQILEVDHVLPVFPSEKDDGNPLHASGLP